MTGPDDRDDPDAAATAVPVVASSIPGEFIVPELVGTFTAAHPEFAVDTEITDSAGVLAALRDGTAEVGFARAEPDGDDLEAEVVTADEIVLAVPRGHALDRTTPGAQLGPRRRRGRRPASAALAAPQSKISTS